MSGIAYRRCLVALTVFFGTVLVLWAVLTPAFRAPDEPQHLNSVMRLATGGGWPAPGTAPMADAVVVAAREGGFAHPAGPISVFGASILPRGTLEAWGIVFADAFPTPPADERSVLDYTAELVDVDTTIDQMTQHPPLYYAVAAGLVRAVGALDWRWDHQLLLLRLLSCAIAVWSIPLVATTARLLTGSRTVGLVAAAGVVGVGQFAHISASVSNDTLTTTLGLASTCLAARALTARHGVWLPLLAGVVLGLGLLTKGTLLPAIPMVAVSFLWPSAANPHALRRWFAAGGALLVAFVVGGWWWARNLVAYGSVQPAGMSSGRLSWGDDTPTVGEFVPEAIARLNESFWGNFGWLELPLPTWLSAVLGGLVTALVLLSLVLRSTPRAGTAVLLLFPAGLIAVVGWGAWQGYLRSGLFPGLQGRYLFPTLAAIFAAAALALTLLARRARPDLPRHLPTVVLAVAMVSAAYALFVVFQGAYQPVDETLQDAVRRWEMWSPLPLRPLVAAVALPVLSGAVAVVVVARSVRTYDPADTDALVAEDAASRPVAAG